MNEETLSEQLIKQFMANAPSVEEIESLNEYVGTGKDKAEKIAELAKPDQFTYEMMQIPRYEQRLNAMSFKMKFNERLEELKPDIMNLTKASTEVKEAKKLRTIFELILTIGNYVNGDSFRGGAYGFDIHTLAKVRTRVFQNDIHESEFLQLIKNMYS